MVAAAIIVLLKRARIARESIGDFIGEVFEERERNEGREFG